MVIFTEKENEVFSKLFLNACEYRYHKDYKGEGNYLIIKIKIKHLDTVRARLLHYLVGTHLLKLFIEEKARQTEHSFIRLLDNHYDSIPLDSNTSNFSVSFSYVLSERGLQFWYYSIGPGSGIKFDTKEGYIKSLQDKFSYHQTC